MTKTTPPLLVLAALFCGLLAGTDFERTFVASPAWHQVDAASWAAYSRRADLGNGVFIYPLLAFASGLLCLAAAIGLHVQTTAPRGATIAADVAVLLAAIGLALTLKAAPIMLGIADITDPAAVGRAFTAFLYWDHWRAICQMLSFAAVLTALFFMLPRNGN